jgi:hypothetical protein
MHRRKKMYVKKFLIAVLIILLVLAVVPVPLNATSTWTVMVYMDGDNNLESAAVDDLNEMEAVGSTSLVNIVVQFDRHSAYDNTNGNWDSTKRFHVKKDANGYDSIITSPVLSDEGEVNMGDPLSLENFITWAQTDFPASHYVLVLWDHGSGWKVPSPVRSVCTDETDGDELTMIEVETALRNATCSGTCPLDIVGFDACYMGMVEVDYEILPYAHYRVGSEEYEPGDGWDYFAFLNFLVHSPYATPEKVAAVIVNSYMSFYGLKGQETQSAVHLNPTSTVVDALDVFSLHLAGAMEFKSDIQRARSDVQFFTDLDYIDLYHYAQLIREYVPHRGIKQDALILMNRIIEAVTSEGHGIMSRNAHGMSIYFPIGAAGYDPNYENAVEFTEDTFWDEFLNQYYSTNYALDAAMVADPNVTSNAETVIITMEVTNISGATVNMVSPSPLTVAPSGTAHAVLASGPTPVSANLVAEESVVYAWEYTVFSGANGGILTFSGNAYGKDSVSGETVFSPLVSASVIVRGLGQTEEPVTSPNEQMQPVADNRVQSAETLYDQLVQQFSTAEDEGKDTTPCEDLLELVEIYLERAQENYQRGNYIAANYWALQAAAAMEDAEECLDNL